MSYRYYSISRPIGPGTFPRPAGNRVENIHNYDRRMHVEEIGREAWGYIEYESPINPEDARGYELVAPGKPRYTVQFHVIDLKGWDGSMEGYDRAFRRAEIVTLHGVEDINGAVMEYSETLPKGRYEIDDIKWREEQ